MASNPLYKHAIAAYGATMVSIPSQNSFGGDKEFRHTLPFCHGGAMTAT